MQLLSNEELVQLVKSDKAQLVQCGDFISIDILTVLKQIIQTEKYCTDVFEDKDCTFLSNPFKCKLFDQSVRGKLPRIDPLEKCPECIKISRELYPELYI